MRCCASKAVRTYLIGTFASIGLCVSAQSAELNVANSNYTVCDKLRGESTCLALRLHGRIEAGDTARLTRTIEQLEASAPRGTSTRVAAIFLHSPGGSVAEAQKLGRLIRSLQIWTQVAQNERCASSCVLVLAAGVARFAIGRVEIHSFYSPDLLGSGDFAKADALYKEAADQVANYLREMRVPQALLDAMMQVPHYGSRELEYEDVKRLGLFGIDPVYAQTRPQPKPTAVRPKGSSN